MSPQNDHYNLLVNTGQIASLVAGSNSIQVFLDRCVELVAESLGADVCSIYLYEEATDDLVLRATMGLRAEMVGHLRLKVGEGLVGCVLRDMRPLYSEKASAHPDFCPVPESGETPYETFLGVPIIRGIERVGVFVVQRYRQHAFSESDIRAMTILAAQLAAAIENARVFLSLAPKGPETNKPLAQPVGLQSSMFRGQTVSPGCALGQAQVMKRIAAARVIELQRQQSEPDGGVQAFDQAVEITMRQLQEGQKRLGQRLPEAASLIFESHLMMLKDNGFVGRIRERIGADVTAGRAIAEVAAEYINIFESSDHDYLREKARDVEDLALRLIDHLSPGTLEEQPEGEAHIVIARELLPSDILRIAQSNAKGIVLVSGGSTAHVSLLVRSLGIPMIIAGSMDLLHIRDGDSVVVDGYTGNVYINPSDLAKASYEQRQRIEDSLLREGERMQDRTETRDGVRVRLLANINLLSELDLARSLKAEGIGLYRTEFPFLVRPDLPTEADQYEVYRRLLEQMPDLPVTFRTLDAGGDKVLSYFDSAGEANPALGLRSTRFSLKFSDVFDQQLRAILRASRGREDVQVMFPMIGSIEEWRDARARFDACAKNVIREGEPFRLPRVGMMVELPAIVELADEFARESDFFSIGTNDFIQYMLAVDRTNERVAHFYIPHHPSVLRGLKRIVDAAKRQNIDVSVCGEMAHDVRYVPFFLGLGVRTLSVEPNYLPRVQAVINKFTIEAAEAYAKSLLEQTIIRDVEALLVKPESLDL